MTTPDAELTVAARDTVAEGVVALSLADARGGRLPPWEPGAHVDLVLGPALVRQYSLCGDPADRGSWRVAVLREPDGRGGSAHVHDRLPVGSSVRVRGPRNNFPLAEAPSYLFVAGGIGITPILPMVHQAAATGARWRLLYGGRRRESMAFLGELEGYGDRVRVCPEDETGLLDLDAALGAAGPGTAVYCCGPEPLIAALESRRTAGWPAGTLHVERFRGAVAGASEAFEVELKRSGHALPVPADRSILEVVEEAGVAVLSSCREGICGTCETEVLSGVPEHRDALLTPAEQAAGDTMMICVSRSRTPRLTLDL